MTDNMLEKPAVGELSIAVLNLDAVAVENLLDRGADANETDENGETPLRYIVTSSGRDSEEAAILRILHLLVERGADPHKKSGDDCSALDMRDEHRGQIDPFYCPTSFRKMDVILSEAPERHRLYVEARAREQAEIRAVIAARENSHASSTESQLRLLARSSGTVVKRRPQP